MGIYVKNLTKLYKPQCVGIRGLFGIRKKIKAVDNVSFEIKDGECVGIIGRNGSGKSTLLKLLCSITSQTSGSISADGRISALLELGTGFNPEYTGISNIYLNGTVLGLKKAEIKALIPEITDFADIGDFIYRPVKTYSDGMFLRLAFACAVAVSPDILIIDEAMSVGDFIFRQKCYKKLESLKAAGTTVIAVSHDIDILRRFCDRALWLDNGRLRMDGDIAKVSAAYMEAVTGGTERALYVSPDNTKNISCLNRFGSAEGSIVSAQIPEVQVTDREQKISLILDIPEEAELRDMAVSLAFKDLSGLDLAVVSTADKGIAFTKTGRLIIDIKYVCRLCPGRYSVSVSLEDRGSQPIKYFDYIDGAATVEVMSDRQYFGLFRMDADYELKEWQA